MSLSLGEKLREAREERGFTIADVAEQTRISSLYLESIENDDYRILPGGIFNKGFVKSYAKFVGINEAEALQDYSALLAQTSSAEDEGDLKVYRPEVLTDDRSTSSMVPTVILAAVILGIMTAGILFLVSYLRQPADVPAANTTAQSNNSNSAEPTPETIPTSTNAPEMASLKVEFKAVGQPVLVTATTDGTKSDVKVAAFDSRGRMEANSGFLVERIIPGTGKFCVQYYRFGNTVQSQVTGYLGRSAASFNFCGHKFRVCW